MNDKVNKIALKLNSFFYFTSWNFLFGFGYFAMQKNNRLMSNII